MHSLDQYFHQMLHECRDPNLRERLRALEILEKEYLGQVKADFLLLCLRRASLYVEQTAILGILSQMGPRAPVEELTNILLNRDASDEMPRFAVADTLAALGEDAPVDVLIGILQDPTEEVGLREEIAGLLGEFGERVPLEVLIAAVGDAEPAICAAGIGSLIEQGPRAPLEPILAHLAIPNGMCGRLRYARSVRHANAPPLNQSSPRLRMLTRVFARLLRWG
jgi:HEAT repeat protein